MGSEMLKMMVRDAMLTYLNELDGEDFEDAGSVLKVESVSYNNAFMEVEYEVKYYRSTRTVDLRMTLTDLLKMLILD